MIFLHISVHSGAAVIWAEKRVPADGDRQSAVKANSVKSRAGSSKIRHPFALNHDELFGVIDSVLSDKKPASLAPKRTFQISLPSSPALPLPSTGLLDPTESVSRKATNLKLWQIDGVPIAYEDLARLLRAKKQHQVLLPGVFLSPEFEYLAHVNHFAEALVAKQHYLPGVSFAQGVYFAIWQPIFQRQDQLRLYELAKSMPPVFRSLGASGDDEIPSAERAIFLLREYLSNAVDSLIRQALGAESDPDHQSMPAAGAPGANAPEVEVARIVASQKTASQFRKEASQFDSVHDCWLDALTSVSGLMNFDSLELQKFARQLGDWQQPIVSIEAAPFRLCFRLDEPGVEDVPTLGEAIDFEDKPNPFDSNSSALSETSRLPFISADHDDKWKVSFLLQSVSDPSLLIPAGEVWNANPKYRPSFTQHSFNPREYLFLSLGQASRLCAEISDSLRSNAPKGYEVDSAGAINFISEKASALEEGGFDVMVPPWWKRRKRLRKKVAVKSGALKADSNLSLDRIVEFQWQIAIGEVPLSLAELNAIADLKTPLVKIRGQWVHMDAGEIKAAIDFLKRRKRDESTVRDLINLSLGAGSIDGDVEIEASGWIDDLIQQLKQPSQVKELAEPTNFIGQLRPYQRRGFSWLSFLSNWGLGACLADDMGLGKTVQTLAMIQHERVGGEQRPVLLVCPTSVVDNWRKEALRFTPDLSVMVHHGSSRRKGEQFKDLVAKHAIVVSSYSLLHRDYAQLKDIEWAGIILDEAQNIKNAETKQSRAAKQLESKYRIALTGTPVENNVGDLWSLMDFLNPGLLGSRESFRKNLFRAIQIERDPDARDRLQKITQPFILRRLKTDKSIISDLPEKQEMKVYCTLSKEQVTLYQAVLKDLERKLDKAEGIEKSGLVLATLSRLKQVCNHPAHFLADNSTLEDRSGKLDRLMEILEEILASKEKLLIFSQFTEMGELIQKHIGEILGEEVLYLHGGTSKKKRDEMVERFQAADGPSIFLLSLKAGGTGLNLTAANHVIHYDRWWNPAVENQASDRAFRIGQTKNVQVRKFICAGTLEDKIDEMIESKRQLAEDVVGSGEGWLTRLSNDELKKVFALSREVLAK